MNFIVEFVANNFSSCIWLAVILLALIPTLESKIAIPFAMNSAMWGEAALQPWQAFLFAFIGSLIPSFIAMLITRKIKSRTTGFIASAVRSKYNIKTTLLEKEKSTFKKYLILTTFVALPLPLTGVWSGSFLAGFSDLKLGKCFIAICVGAFISCLIVTLLCAVFENSIGYILMFSIAVVVLYLIAEFSIDILKPILKKYRK